MKNEAASVGAAAKKKNILILAAIALIVIAVLAVAVQMMGGSMEGFAPDEELIEQYYEQNKDRFKAPDFTLSAEDDAAYMRDYDRRIYYVDGPIRTELSADGELPLPQLAPVVDMIAIITAGDTVAYNRLFTSSYLAQKGEQAPFTAQKPYNIEITYIGLSESGTLFKLNYCLKDNDGTLRRDMVSDMSRTMNLTVTELDGAYYIASIGYHFAFR